ncbi:MAG TPA: hypothetical protein VMX97_09880, partial [Hyphomicrobiaceae bacterium]|nr:hypothetical protein [Hyphomicrobiaceae bacterium]
MKQDGQSPNAAAHSTGQPEPQQMPAQEDTHGGVLVHPAVAPKIGIDRTLAAGLLALLALFAGLFGWMALTKISGAVVASGTVAVKGKPKSVQHLDGGVVQAIAVANGDVVKPGVTLLRLDDTLLAANLKIYHNRLVEALAQRARLTSERDAKTTIEWPAPADSPLGVVPGEQIRLSQQKLLDVRLASRKGQLDQLNEKIAQYRNQIAGVKGLKSAKADQIALIDRELKGLKGLYDQGNTT